MPQTNEFDYRGAIERLIPDFPQVSRLWPLGVRLALLILLELAILGLSLVTNGGGHAIDLTLAQSHGIDAAGWLLINIAAPWIALKSSIPGCEIGFVPIALMALGGVAEILVFCLRLGQTPSVVGDSPYMILSQLSFILLPWSALLWPARRAMPLHPRLTGTMIGLGASSFGLAPDRLSGLGYQIAPQLISAATITITLGAVGAISLAPRCPWRREVSASLKSSGMARWFDAGIILPAAIAASAVLLLVGLRAGDLNPAIPDFDLTIANYDQSIIGFRPNVASSSLATVLTAYIEDGVPSYMWDFGPAGYKLVGGRFEHLSDGTPVTFTWFRGPRAGVMCIFRQTSGFKAPMGTRVARGNRFFYRYRGFSVCLINVGGYGDFVSVIVAPIAIKPFMQMVTAALVSAPH